MSRIEIKCCHPQEEKEKKRQKRKRQKKIDKDMFGQKLNAGRKREKKTQKETNTEKQEAKICSDRNQMLSPTGGTKRFKETERDSQRKTRDKDIK